LHCRYVQWVLCTKESISICFGKGVNICKVLWKAYEVKVFPYVAKYYLIYTFNLCNF
jgi:hypothetical protein